MYLIHYCAWDIPNGYTLKRIALINATKINNDEALILDATGVSTNNGSNSYKTYNVAWNIIPNVNAINEHRLHRARLACVVEKDGVEETIYSNAVHVQL